MTGADEPDGDAVAEVAWHLLASVAEAVRRELDRALSEAGLLSEADFTVVRALVGFGADGCRLVTCAEAIGWDRSRLSHQVKRMERRGLVRRHRPGATTADRAPVLRATDSATSAYLATLDERSRFIRDRFSAALSLERLRALSGALELLSPAPGREGRPAPLR